jgi:hypothetical protein
MATDKLQQPEQKNKSGIVGYAGKFAGNLMKYNFWTRMGGVSNGAILAGEAALLSMPFLRRIAFLSKLLSNGAVLVMQAALHSLPPVLMPLAWASYGLLAAAGLYSVRHGLSGMWKSLEKAFSETFSTFNPLKALRLRVEPIIKKISENPFMQKLCDRRKNLTGKVAQNPLLNKIAERPLVQKFLNSRIGRCRHGLTQGQRDVFMAGTAIEGSLFTIAFCSSYIAKHMAAAHLSVGGCLRAGAKIVAATPHFASGGLLTGSAGFSAAAVPFFAIGALLTVGMAFAAYEVVSSTIGLYCYTKTLTQVARNRKAAKLRIANGRAPESSTAASLSQETKAPPMPENKTPVFNRKAKQLSKAVLSFPRSMKKVRAGASPD